MVGRIYKITNLLNGKMYVGQTIQSIKDRWYRHVGNSKWLSQAESDMVIKKAIRKYGKENFKIELIEECDRALLDEREIYWISFYDTYNNGYNSTKGGQGGIRPFKITSEEDIDTIINLYKSGKSLRAIGTIFNVDKATIKSVLINNNIPLKKVREYKFTHEDRLKIIEDFNKGMSRKDIYTKYKISHSYLSQILNKNRRI